MTIDVDVAASTAAIGDAVLTLVFTTTPAPVAATPAPVADSYHYYDDDDDDDNCAQLWDHGLGPEYAGARPDGTPCEPGCECCRADGGCGECAWEQVCEVHGDYGFCTPCEAKFAGDDGLIEHCRNEAVWGFYHDGTRYDNTCSFGHYYDYYHEEDDDDDDDGGSELVMSGGLVAIGLTFTGISIAAIANAVQEQCALGPTIVYEAGTTHPYYISPNLCTIGTKTFSSDKTVRDASPRKVCRKFCEAASAAGKLALKHVQGLTCYCKRR
jgi:hypothetical protein